MGNPKFIVAPMVEQSELPWRILSRRYGAQLCFTPMINAKVFLDENQKSYHESVFSTCSTDRPLIAQFCGNNPEILLKAAQKLQHCCDAIDLNLGCPQGIAKRGHYGSYLQDEWELIETIVKTLNTNLTIPVTCKIRIFPDVEKTLRYAKMLQNAGCKMLTVHGRTREQRGSATGLADWEQIRRVKQELSIPVVANGNILYLDDIQKCLDFTGCDGVMTAEGNLYNPAIFTKTFYSPWQLAKEYLDLCAEFPVPMSIIRSHLFKLYKHVIHNHVELRDKMAFAKTLNEFVEINQNLEDALTNTYGADIEPFSGEFTKNPQGYFDIPSYYCQPYIRKDTGLECSKVEDTNNSQQKHVIDQPSNENQPKRANLVTVESTE